MNWTSTLIRYGFTQEQAGQVQDPFQALAAADKTAEVRAELSTSTDFGQVRCTISVTCKCPQAENCINLAAELVFRKALEFTNAGASQIGAPLLPPFTEPK